MFVVAADHTQTYTHTHTHAHAIDRSLLDEGSASRRDIYLTTHNIHKRDITRSPAGLEPSNDRAQNHALHWASRPKCAAEFFRGKFVK
jgi:hypothetical protein